MSKTQQVQQAMVAAMKAHDAPRKEVLSLLLSALKGKAKDKREDLTEEEEDGVILKEIKSTKETLESSPAERTDIIDQCNYTLTILGEFAPQRMGEEEIRAILAGVLGELGLTAPTAKDKGLVMKSLMPLVKGKADGALVNRLVGEILQ